MRRGTIANTCFGLIVGFAFVLFAVLPIQAAVPTQVSFQGYLTDSTGVPVPDGDYSMQFYLFDAPTGGSQLWNPNAGEAQTVTVAGGIYQVQLGAVQPLDSSVFDGGVAWLEVVIDGETLSPRQLITAAAYALKAGDADTLGGNTVGNLDARYVQPGEASVVTSTMIADGAVTAADLGTNSVGASQIAAGAVGSSEVAADSLTAADMAADSVGQSELAPNSVGSAEIINGQVTAADMQDGAALAEIADDDGPGSGLNADFLDNYNSTAFTLTSQDYGRINVSSTLYEGAASLTSKYVEQAGDTMTGQLTISKIGTGFYADLNAGAATTYGLYVNADQSDAYNYPTYGLYVDADSAASSAYLYGNYTNAQKSSGTGSIYGAYNYANHGGTGGTTYGAYANAYGSDTGSAYGMRGYAHKPSTDTAGTAYGGRFIADNDSSGSSYGLYAEATGASGTNTAVRAIASGGDYNYAIYGSATDGTDWAGYFYGPVGIDGYGTGTDIQSVIIDPDDKSIELFEADGTLTVLLDGDSGTNGGPYLYMYNSSGTRTVWLDGDSADSAYIALSNASGSNTIILDADYGGDGRIITQELQITGGSDFSEQFDIQGKDITLAPGLVVSIDPDRPGHLSVSNHAYDNKVAGIISGAGGIKPGMMMGQQGTEADGQHPVALSGRVYCWADTSAGAIQPGDLLTTSTRPGHAMKATDRDLAFGATIGKAMTALDEGTGLVLVLVSLQ
jgi:hypothetical protein